MWNSYLMHPLGNHAKFFLKTSTLFHFSYVVHVDLKHLLHSDHTNTKCQMSTLVWDWWCLTCLVFRKQSSLISYLEIAYMPFPHNCWWHCLGNMLWWCYCYLIIYLRLESLLNVTLATNLKQFFSAKTYYLLYQHILLKIIWFVNNISPLKRSCYENKEINKK